MNSKLTTKKTHVRIGMRDRELDNNKPNLKSFRNNEMY